jgi:hypothetical protein
MRIHTSSRSIGIAAATVALAAVGCGSDTRTRVEWQTKDGEGKVSILIVDGPSPALDRAFITVTSVSLVPAGDGDPVTVFEGSERIDLLRYREEDLLLAAGAGVPAGRYAKVRLEVSGVEVEPREACSEVKLPSGKIDLVPRGEIEVTPETPIAVRVDIDAGKSISVHATGQGKCIFRPVVFADVLSGDPAERCPREVAGTISRIERSGGDAEGAGGPPPASVVLDLGGGRGTVRAEIEEGTPIFDDRGIPTGLAGLEAGETLRVRGRSLRSGDPAAIRAIWAISGEPLDLRGAVETAPSGGRFDLQVDRDGTVSCETTAASIAYSPCGTDPLPLDGIVAGRRVRVLGGREAGESALRVAVLVLEPFRLRGEISGLDLGAGRMAIRTAEGETIEIDIDAGAEVVLSGDGDLSIDDLRTGQTVEVIVSAAGEAERIEVAVEGASGIVTFLDSSRGWFLLLEEPSGDSDLPAAEVQVSLGPSARLLIISKDEIAVPAVLGDLKDGDRVSAFGVCPETGVLEARTVVIRR